MSKLKVNNIEAYSGATIVVDTNTIFNKDVTVSGNLVFGDADTDSIDFNADIVSNIIPDASSTYNIGSATKMWGDLHLGGTAALTTVTVSGALTVNGNTTLGNADTDSITINAEFMSGLIPNTDSIYHLGSSTKKWGNLFAGGGAWVDGSLTVGGDATLNQNVTIVGDLHVDGDTVYNNVTTMTVQDPIIKIGGGVDGAAPAAADNKDRGIEFQYFDGSAKLGFFGFDDSTGRFTFVPDGSNTSEVISGNRGELEVAGIRISDNGSSFGLQLGVTSNNEIDTAAGNLTLNSAGGTVAVNDNLTVSGSATIDTNTLHADANLNRVGVGTTTPGHKFEVFSGSISVREEAATASGKALKFKKSRAAGAMTIVQDADGLGALQWFGADGTNWIRGAQISAAVNGTPGTNDMPGRLIFSTTADGASSVTERMTVLANGNVGIGLNNPAHTLDVVGDVNLTGDLSFDGSATVASSLIDDDTMGTASATSLASSESIKAYVDSAVTAQDLDFIADDASNLSIDLDSEVFNIAGGTGVTTTGSGNQVSIATDAAQGHVTSLGTLTALTGVTGDLNWDSGTLFVDSSEGSVGIGTTTPAKTLEVKAASSGNGINLIGHDTATAVIQLESGSAGGYVQVHDSANNQKVRLDSAGNSFFGGGNVGIGTDDPIQQLTVGSGISGTTARVAINSGAARDATLDLYKNTGAFGTAGPTGFRIQFDGIANTFNIQSGDDTTVNTRLTIERDSGNVGIGTASPDASSILQLSSTTAGFLPPKMTTTQRNAISAPVAGLLIYNTTDNKLQCHNGAGWQNCF